MSLESLQQLHHIDLWLRDDIEAVQLDPIGRCREVGLDEPRRKHLRGSSA
jgi:hypothetical protein